MNTKKWLISAVTLTLALGTADAVTAFSITGDGGSDNPDDLNLAGEILHGDPTYDEWLSDVEDGTVVTSIDDIDPNECNGIHNINAFTPEELEELGIAPITGSIAVGELHPGTEVEGKPEPLFEDGERGYEVQSYEEAVEQDCNLAGGIVYVTSGGDVGCVVQDLEDSGEEMVSPPQPPTVKPQPVPDAQ